MEMRGHPLRKRRTRQHIIADLSVNHVERQALLAGYTVEVVRHDYGIDLTMETYTEDGESESSHVLLQLKASDAPAVAADGQWIAVSVARADLERWLGEVMPCLLVLYDAAADMAYWAYLQAEFESRSGFDLRRAGRTVTVRIPTANVLDVAAVKRTAAFKNDVLRQAQGRVTHRVR